MQIWDIKCQIWDIGTQIKKMWQDVTVDRNTKGGNKMLNISLQLQQKDIKRGYRK